MAEKLKLHFPKQTYSPTWGHLSGDVTLDDSEGKATAYYNALTKAGSLVEKGHKGKAEKPPAKEPAKDPVKDPVKKA